MSKYGGTGPRTLRISSDGVGSRVELDGQNVASALTGLSLRMAVGDLPTATLDVVVRDLTTELDGVRVELPESTRRLLAELGWTPPPDDEQQGGEG